MSNVSSLQVQYVDYMDELAQLVGCKPRLLKRLLTDPQLGSRLLFQGLVPYQFRLDGPHAWSGARDAIMGMERRMVENTRRKPLEGKQQKEKTKKAKKTLGLWRAIGGFF